jgi:hypothetical protein
MGQVAAIQLRSQQSLGHADALIEVAGFAGRPMLNRAAETRLQQRLADAEIGAYACSRR